MLSRPTPLPGRPMPRSRFWTLLIALILSAVCEFGLMFPRMADAQPATTVTAAAAATATSQSATAATAAKAAAVSYDDALDAQIKTAQAAGIPVTLAPGVHVLHRPHVIDGVDLIGTGCTLDVSGLPQVLAPGAAAITVRNTWNDNYRPRVEGVWIRGPGSLTLGKRTAGCDGLRIECQAFAEFVRVQGFDGGLVFASSQGHVRLRGCTGTRNYYNLYFALGGGDYSVEDSYLDGAAMASIAAPGNVGIEGLCVRQTHLGFSPYGVYQEAPAAGQTPAPFFLEDCEFDQARFEMCGNGALVSLVPGTPGAARCETRDVTITLPGFSWGDAYRLPGLPRAYALSGDLMDGRVVIDGGSHPFLPGDKGIYGFSQYAASIPGYPASISVDGVAVTALH